MEVFIQKQWATGVRDRRIRRFIGAEWAAARSLGPKDVRDPGNVFRLHRPERRRRSCR